ncbi:MAG: sulfite exporter TauE/SafE family protein [Bacteroidales bacterium]|nr:sulfite exporter TauE/SafE family protein [Candidatus Liminaster caballi]
MILLILFCIGAAFVQRVSGFGFGIFIMTILPYLMPSYGEATALSGLLAAVTSILIVWKMHSHISWRRLWPILFTFIIVSYVSVKFVSSAGDIVLKRMLGVMLILAAVWFMFFSRHIRVRPSIPVQVAMGTLSGVMGGLFGMQGPPAVLYFLACTGTKEGYIALTQCYFLVGNLMMTVFRAGEGYLTADVGKAWCVGVPAVLLGTWLGSKVFDRIPLNVLRTIIYIYMAISGAVAIFA